MRKNFRRVGERGSPLKRCPSCGICLMTVAELALTTGVPHSTAIQRIRKADVTPVTTEGKRDLYDPTSTIPVVMGIQR